MKTTLLIVLACGQLFLCQSQVIEKFTIDSGGATVNTGGLEVVYTIGEVLILERSDSSISVSEGFLNANFQIKIEPIAFLQGPLLNQNTLGLMNDDLRSAAFIPTTSPYLDAIQCDSSVFIVTGNDAIVDWVWVELRDANDSSQIVYAQSALLQRDGDIVNVDGISSLSIGAPPKSYFIAVNHRNHLGVMTNTPVALLEGIPTIIDFTSNSFTDFGTNAQIILPSGAKALWAGNVNDDSIIQYSGTDPDTPTILSDVLNDPLNFLGFPTYISQGYSNSDVNMDGNTQYTGTNPDSPIILQNVLSHPGNFLNFSTYQIIEQLNDN